MKKLTPQEQGWAYAAQISGAKVAGNMGQAYVNQVNKAIDSAVESLKQLKSNQTDAALGGFVAENWHAETFNINATVAGSKNIAIAGAPGTDSELGRNNYGSVDVRVQTKGGKVINDYGSKYRVNAKETAKQQAAPSEIGTDPKYHGQKRLVASDQKEDVIKIASKRASNEKTPENWRKGYEEVAEETTDTISDGKVHSDKLSKSESEELAREIKEDRLDAEKHGLTADEKITYPYIAKQAAKAGLNAAVLTALIQATPNLMHAMNYLIQNKAVDLESLKKAGSQALAGGAEGFLRGFFACYIQVLCNKGKFGPLLVNADPLYVGTVVALTIQTIKNSIDVARGKMTLREMGSSLIDSVIISAGYIVGSKIGAAIGAALTFEFPFIGLLIGSLIGSAFGAAYGIAKKRFLSLCVDTGFTCFGLVDQDYTLPEEVLKDMGLDITPIERVEVSKNGLDIVEMTDDVDRTDFETVEIKVLRRGILGVNKIGYIY